MSWPEIDGAYHRLDLRGFNLGRKPVRSSIPIHVPALFENTVALAGEIADGLLGHPVWSLKWIAEQAARLDRTLAAKARKRSDFHVNLWNYVAIANDRKQAIDDMRGTVAFYSSIAQYRKYYAAQGFGAQAVAVTEAAARKDTAAMLKVVPDEMVTTFAIAGTPDDARERVAKMWEYVIDDAIAAAVFRSAGADERVPERDCRHTLPGLTGEGAVKSDTCWIFVIRPIRNRRGRVSLRDVGAGRVRRSCWARFDLAHGASLRG